ncbi:MAG: hypothetical protein WDW36_008961 [Sanguina aurantia]
MRVPLPLSPLRGLGRGRPVTVAAYNTCVGGDFRPHDLDGAVRVLRAHKSCNPGGVVRAVETPDEASNQALAQHLQPRKSAPVETITRLTRARCVNTSAEGNNCSIRALAAGVLTLSDNLVASAAARHLAGNNFAAGRRQIAQLCSRPGSSGHGLSPENLRQAPPLPSSSLRRGVIPVQFFGHPTGVLSGDVHVKDIVVLLLMGLCLTPDIEPAPSHQANIKPCLQREVETSVPAVGLLPARPSYLEKARLPPLPKAGPRGNAKVASEGGFPAPRHTCNCSSPGATTTSEAAHGANHCGHPRASYKPPPAPITSPTAAPSLATDAATRAAADNPAVAVVHAPPAAPLPEWDKKRYDRHRVALMPRIRPALAASAPIPPGPAHVLPSPGSAPSCPQRAPSPPRHQTHSTMPAPPAAVPVPDPPCPPFSKVFFTAAAVPGEWRAGRLRRFAPSVAPHRRMERRRKESREGESSESHTPPNTAGAARVRDATREPPSDDPSASEGAPPGDEPPTVAGRGPVGGNVGSPHRP